MVERRCFLCAFWPTVDHGAGGCLMSYDGENRPLSVTHGGAVTTYTYGTEVTYLHHDHLVEATRL